MSSPGYCRPMIALASAAATMIGVAALPHRAAAADLDSMFTGAPQPAETQPVEFGTGWYLRGDLAYANDSVPPLAPNLTQFLSSSRQANFNADLGFGYKFNNWFRGDVIVDYWNPISASGQGVGKTCITQVTTIDNFPTVTATDRCTPQYHSNIRRWDFLANAYADLGTWYGFTPYIGGGVGVSMTRISSATNWYMSNGLPYQVTTDGFYYNWDSSSGFMRYQFAWALMAGFAYPIMDHLLLDVGYRYINLGTLPGIADPSGQVVNKTMDAHELRVGFRYQID